MTDRNLEVDAAGHPHIAYGGSYLYYAWHDGTSWHYETVDDAPNVGWAASIVLDGNGYPHISYYDSTYDALKYAYQDHSGWHSQTVDSAGLVGSYTSLALATTAPYTPHISYYDATNERLKYAYLGVTGWHRPTVGTFYPSGKYTSLVLDDNGYPHISYYCHYFNDLRYTRQVSATRWSGSVVAYYSEDWFKVGMFNSLALDADGHPHISYYDATLGNLKYAYFSTKPIAAFTADPTTGIAPLTVAFTDTSTGGEADTWLWSFGDSEISTRQNPTHTYTAAGAYTVTLAVSGPGGSDAVSYTHYINVYAPVQAAFTATPTSGPVPLNVAFTNTSMGDYDASLWDFGDGLTSTLQSPTHTYTMIGTHTVTLTVSGPGGTDKISHTDAITVYEAVKAEFTASPVQGAAPLGVTFTNTSSGPASVWQWEFGDGTRSNQQHPNHIYTTTGTYTVSLTAQVDGASAMLPGGTDIQIRTHYITVTQASPAVDFIGDPRSGSAPLKVQFTSIVTGEVTTYAWRFGDGGIANTPNPTHTYTSAGSFGVTLSFTGPGGPAQTTKPDYITINPPPGAPTATFSTDVVSGIAPLTVTFTAITSGTVQGWYWRFGDGSAAFTGPEVSHTYVTSGTFDVSLTVSNTIDSYTVNKLNYIRVKTESEPLHAIYLPLVLRDAP